MHELPRTIPDVRMLRKPLSCRSSLVIREAKQPKKR